ncbi:hypothetical protein H632_c1527p0 [Helicosporidium sp. ATCC 50920]|nr:hypothetical protein H632_c1527p0 [Helicosporidium sp. ATCC 50920]|eukprot:KDD74152.1 hypothetical protein H632_c1527p0 [Helicosporidium sp. ATCC 50920]
MLTFSSWCLGTAALGAPLAWWLLRARSCSTGGAVGDVSASTGFEAYLVDVKVNAPKQETRAAHCSTSFEAYLVSVEQEGGIEGELVPAAPSLPPPPPESKPIVILFGTEFGFSREIAEKLADSLAQNDVYWPLVLDMARFPDGLSQLPDAQALLVVVSTQGDGVPPADARAFCDWLAAQTESGSLNLASTPVSVCGLGDSAYANFCRCGKTVEAALVACGAPVLAARQEVNREDWRAVDGWMARVRAALDVLSLKTVAELGGRAPLWECQAGGAGGGPDAAPASLKAYRGLPWSRSRPFAARVAALEALCAVENAEDKNTVRIEFDLGSSDISYLPGDALGVWPANPPAAVSALLFALGLTGAEPAPVPAWAAFLRFHEGEEDASTAPLAWVLSRCYDLRQPKPALFNFLLQRLGGDVSKANGNGHVVDAAACNGHSAAREAASPASLLERLTEDAAAREDFLAPRHASDVLAQFFPRSKSSALPLDAFLQCLRPLAPRLYSISSSPLEGHARVCATVAEVAYDSLGAPREGVASCQISRRALVAEPGKDCDVESGDAQRQTYPSLPVYIHPNPDFRLPSDPATPIVMVGPGTGLAPFRAFVHHRRLAPPAVGKAGPAKLFFGCRRPDQDFLYASELQELAQGGHVELHVAFSRVPGQKKVYVQDLLREEKERVWELLEQGAHFYVCGDATRMAGDVDLALREIAAERIGRPEAEVFVDALLTSGRYQRDVWIS